MENYKYFIVFSLIIGAMLVTSPVAADFYKKILEVVVINIETNAVDNALVTIDLEHHRIHEGFHYILDTIVEDVDIASPHTWLMLAPTENDVHMFFSATSSAAGIFEFFENTTTSANGTLTVPYNNNRTSSNQAGLIVYNDSTVTADGDRLLVGYVGSGTGKKSVGGVGERNEEFILRHGYNYSVKFTSVDDNTIVSLAMHWYEVE